ncbi:6342_t:CDS:2 [Paraglomus brasilianum]|uniref:6342_t:CDS:1 n=1 Tax=Paraglomus brasilianum TaxID=144538 RepID=A0A9N8ZAE7_9GLOM|nr:6342_t:CDS:2 [Paraglomus brasilianum]
MRPVSRERSLELYDDGKKISNEDNDSRAKMESSMEDMIKARFAGLKTDLEYMDPLKEYLCVTMDREGEIFDIHAEFDDNPVTTEPSFEDVMTLWVSVLMWSAQMVVVNKPYTQTASRITGRIYALIKQSGEEE